MTASDERPADAAREGLDHLQSAAKEMVAAARSMLDAIDELLDDPRAGMGLAAAFGTMSRLVEGAVASVGSVIANATGDATSEDDSDGRVQRIKVS